MKQHVMSLTRQIYVSKSEKLQMEAKSHQSELEAVTQRSGPCYSKNVSICSEGKNLYREYE